MINDSGMRTRFDTGAVRDVHSEEKGRFDLLPMRVLMRLARHYAEGCAKYGDKNWRKGDRDDWQLHKRRALPVLQAR